MKDNSATVGAILFVVAVTAIILGLMVGYDVSRYHLSRSVERSWSMYIKAVDNQHDLNVRKEAESRKAAIDKWAELEMSKSGAR